MPRVAKCSVCTESHEPPRGAQCIRAITQIAETVQTLQRELAALKQTAPQRETERSQVEDTSSSSSSSSNNGQSRTCDGDGQSRIRDGDESTQTLRNDSRLQTNVSRRLHELGLDDTSDEDGIQEQPKPRKSKLTSGRKRTAVDVAHVEVEWPQYHIFRGPGRDAAGYDELSVTEFVQGYVAIMLDAGAKGDTWRQQLQHLQQLMMDAGDYGWPSVRNAHGVILQQMEAGKLTWADSAGLADTRRTYCQRYQAGRQATRVKASAQGSRFCLKYQNKRCTHTGDHMIGADQVRHMCAYCFRATGEAFTHAEVDCVRKQKSKNDESQGAVGGQ